MSERACGSCGANLTGAHHNKKYCNPECRYQIYGAVARQSSMQWRRDNYEQSLRNDHNKHLVKKYGITIEQFEQMVVERGNRCEICLRTPAEVGDNRRLSVDHCHKTGRVRGLLCRWCNTAIGQLQDSTDVMQRAVDYMKRVNRV